MASEIPAVQAKDEDCSQHGKTRSLHHHSLKSCKEKSFLPSGIKNVDLLEKVGALKTEKLPRQTARDKLEGNNSVAPPLWTSQKPWPGRKATCVDEPVKNMSNVPRYLHRTDKGDNIHEKALNFGVLEWGLLERWAYHQDCTTDLRGGECSRTMPSYLSRGKKSHSGLTQKKRSVVSTTTKTCARENSKHMKDYRDPRISFTGIPTQHDKQLDADFCLSADILGHKHNKSCSRISDMKAANREGDLAPHSAAPPSRYKIEDVAASRVVEDQNGSLAKAAMSDDYPDRAEMSNVLPRSSQDSQVSWEYLQGSADNVCLISHSPFKTNGWLDKRKCNNLLGDLAEDFDDIHQYSRIPHSCPLSLATMSDEPDDTSSTLPSETVVQVEKSMTDDLFSRGPSKNRENRATQGLIRSEEKETSAAGKKSSGHASYAGQKHMSTSCSSKIGSSKEKPESISSLYNSNGDQANRNSKSRQSPLRRLLDPLLKLKNNPAVPNRHSCDLGGTCKSSDDLHKLSISSTDSTFQVRRSMDTSKQSSQNGRGMQQDKSHVAQMNQAFLQLATKNGLPLFMLSSPGNEVLAAMVAARSISSNDDLDYRIFSLKDSQKKSKFWSNPGSKSKNHQLISNVVGQLKVSLRKLKSYEYDSSHDVREFVLLGAELAPSPQKPIDSPIKNELAAVVLKVPLHRSKSINIGMLCNSKYGGSLPTNSVDLSSPNEDDAAEPGITVILPGGVHGPSTDGEPSPLIERWRSGGTCDCGGWDEGCKLTILSNKFEERNTFGSLQDCQNTYSACRFELFVEGGSQEKAFSMVPFKEGQYAVNFLSSISLLQAFAICIAILHGRKLSDHSAEHKSLHEHIGNNQLGNAPSETPGDSTSYVPNHPPLSPVGRA